jgi:DNA-binding transcriptional regulator YbjK
MHRIAEAKNEVGSRSLARQDRVGLIGEAVIRILAREGARALTHRRVDRELGFPEGSTSAYCRRREDLFTAGHRRLITMAVASFDDLMAPIFSKLTQAGAAPVASIAAELHRAWLSFSESDIMKAQLEFLIEAARLPELRELEDHYLKVQHDRLEQICRSLGMTHARSAAVDLANWMRASAWVAYLCPAGYRSELGAADFERKLVDLGQARTS